MVAPKNGNFNAEFLRTILGYDPHTGIFVWRVKPRKSTLIGEVAGIATTYLRIGWRGRLYSAHRLAWLHYYGEWPVSYMDHINGNKLDNRICNLRVVTSAQNNWNRGFQGNKTYKGVDYVKLDKIWRARIMIHGKRTPLGRFKTKDEAINAYNKAAKKLHGKFAHD